MEASTNDAQFDAKQIPTKKWYANKIHSLRVNSALKLHEKLFTSFFVLVARKLPVQQFKTCFLSGIFYLLAHSNLCGMRNLQWNKEFARKMRNFRAKLETLYQVYYVQGVPVIVESGHAKFS